MPDDYAKPPYITLSYFPALIQEPRYVISTHLSRKLRPIIKVPVNYEYTEKILR
jgi:hypothetical protein